MIEPDRVAELALALPEAEEADHRGRRSFLVRGRIFAVLRPAERLAVLKLPREAQRALVDSEPAAFRLVGWERQGWTGVSLEALDAARLAGLLEDAWCEVVPAPLLRAQQAGER